jgi:nicotinic acid phosphoribosyltransferase
VATKAARMIMASRGRSILEFSTEKMHHEFSVDSARSAYIAGFSSTSNIEAAIRYKIPIADVNSYMYIIVDKNNKSGSALFINKYKTLNGAKPLTSKLSHLKGIILDVINLNWLPEIRKLLNNNIKIIISGNLDEYCIDKLSKFGGLIDSYIVENPLFIFTNSDGLYNPLVVNYEIVYNNESNKPFHSLFYIPGRKQVFLDQRNNGWSHLLAEENVIQPSSELIPLLDCYIKNGKAQRKNIIDLNISRKYCNASLLNIPSEFTSLIKILNSPLYIHESIKE